MPVGLVTWSVNERFPGFPFFYCYFFITLINVTNAKIWWTEKCLGWEVFERFNLNIFKTLISLT